MDVSMKRMLCLLLALLLPLSAVAEGAGLMLRITRNGETTLHTAAHGKIDQREPTPEEVSAGTGAYDGLTIDVAESASAAGVTYRNDYEFAPHETLGFRTHEVSRFSKHEGKTCLWTTEIRDYWVRGWQEVREGVLLWGYTDVSLGSYGYPITAWMTLLSHDGEVVWSQPLTPEVDWEQTAFVIERGDGVYAAFSSYFDGEQEVLIVRQIGADGRLAGFTEIPATAMGLTGKRPRFSICAVLPMDGAYLLHLMSGTAHFLVQVDGGGALQKVIAYEGTEDERLPLTHMLYHGGSLWLSGYLTPGDIDADYFANSRSEVEDVLAEAYSRMQGVGTIDVGWLDVHINVGSKPVDSEFLVPRIREKYTAVLLCVDPETFLPRLAYTVDGCLGGALAAADGGASWNVESLTRCIYSPFTSSFTVSVMSSIFRYAFSPDGMLTGGGETDEFAGYIR